MAKVRGGSSATSRWRPAIAIGGDAVRIALGYLVVLVLRFDGSVPERYWERFFWFVPIAIAVHTTAIWRWRMYDEIWTVAGIREARRMIEANVAAVTVLLVVDIALPERLPISVVALGGGVAIALIGAARFHPRLISSARTDPGHGTAASRVAIIGAGDAGAAVVRSLTPAASHGLVPVVAVDDNRMLHGLTLLGVPVAGTIEELPAIADRFSVRLALLCIPHASPQLVQRAATAAEEAGVTLKIVPAIDEVLRGRSAAASVRDVRIDDLLGRQQVETDLAAVAALIGGRRVLITGAGGSIGAEMARQIAVLAPSELVLLDHDETHLHDISSELPTPVTQVLADIRDAEVIRRLFLQHRPEVVFHAAAHKHVPLLEQNPCEAVRTNVLGTANLLAAADAVGTHRFVLISTDKAVEAQSVMGASKAICEQLVTRASALGVGRYCSVRFGNVLGSRGSVIPTFTRQIERGGPVTVTDPRMTRFFMSTHEAVQLVLQASAMTEGGEVYMLEMGEAVNILDLAERMIRLSGLEVGRDIEIQIVGSRPGEKVHERLTATDEREESTRHSSIKRVLTRNTDGKRLVSAVRELAALVAAGDDDTVANALLRIGSAPAHTEEHTTWSRTTT